MGFLGKCSIGVSRAQERAALAVGHPRLSGPAEQLVVDEEGHAERPARITGRRLDPEGVEWPLT